MISLPPLNAVDWILVIVLAFFILEGWNAGFTELVWSVFGLLLALLTATVFYHQAAWIISIIIPQAKSYSVLIGFVTLLLLGHIAATKLLSMLFRRFSLNMFGTLTDKIAGVAVSVLLGLMIMAVTLTITNALPFNGFVSQQISSSYIAENILGVFAANFSRLTDDIKIPYDSKLAFLTVTPGSKDRLILNIKPQNWDLMPDESSELALFELVNQERIKTGVPVLAKDNALTSVARARSQNMFDNRYFSHYDPDGNDVTVFLDKNQIPYIIAGENLAYAADISVAFSGLFSSENHRANMLDRRFRKTGVGVIDSSEYGKIFTQIFTD